MNLGETVRRLRTQQGMTLEDLAFKAGTDSGNLSRFENGKAGYSTVKMKQIADALGVPLSRIYSGSEVEEYVTEVLQKAGWEVTRPERTGRKRLLFTPDLEVAKNDRQYKLEITGFKNWARSNFHLIPERRDWMEGQDVLLIDSDRWPESTEDLLRALQDGPEATLALKADQLQQLDTGVQRIRSKRDQTSDELNEPSTSGLIPLLAWEHEDDLPPGEYVQIPRLEIHLSAGPGKDQIEIEFVKQQPQAFRSEWIRKKRLKPGKLACMYAAGDSMEDRIFDGDSLVIDTGDTTVVDGRVYALWYDGGDRVKRLYRRPGGGMLIRSDNDRKHPEILLTAEEAEHVRIIGRVVQVSGDQGL